MQCFTLSSADRSSCRAHIPMEMEHRAMGEAKMKRNVVPVSFGKAEPKRVGDRDREELETQRRRALRITETRPLTKPGGRGR